MKTRENNLVLENDNLQVAKTSDFEDVDNEKKDNHTLDDIGSTLEKSEEEENHVANDMRMQMVQVRSDFKNSEKLLIFLTCTDDERSLC